MTSILQRIRSPEPTFSIELWPARTVEATVRLNAALPVITSLEPTFMSITYGAGGSTRDRTHSLVVRIVHETGLDAVAHLTCASHTRQELEWILDRYRRAGVSTILALRGDPPLDGQSELKDGELKHAVELVRLARQTGDFTVAVAAHPEGHPNASSRAEDEGHFVAKLEEADFAISQFFFTEDVYLDFVERVRAKGATKPILPGIMAPKSVNGLFKMSELSGASIPAPMRAEFLRFADDPVSIRRLGVDVAISLARGLLEAGVPGVHIYSMNSLESTVEIHEGIADLLVVE
ncbi:MAG: 5,10-methylenetetrahydrofolate reductase [Acidimicrobiaceae bacterium]|nr:5,10-methylenetetrahydrofolate reductase [Acidimicrobiaceae bacterium]